MFSLTVYKCVLAAKMDMFSIIFLNCLPKHKGYIGKRLSVINIQ